MDNYGPLPDSITTDVQNAIYKLMRHLEVISGVRVEKVCQDFVYIITYLLICYQN